MRKILVIIIFILNFQTLTLSAQADDLVKDANNGDAVSQNNLGFNYLYGINGYSKDMEKAIEYLNLAAAQEQVNAMTTVGWTYFTGEHGAPKDNEQAIYWNQRASDLGCAIASYNMGFFYYGGLAGLDQDLNEAKRFWLLSASQYIDLSNKCRADPDELLKEINQYKKNPTKKMEKLRDFYITLLKSKPI